jgi:hypothetical protein
MGDTAFLYPDRKGGKKIPTSWQEDGENDFIHQATVCILLKNGRGA